MGKTPSPYQIHRDEDLVRKKCKSCGADTVYPSWTSPDRVRQGFCVLCFMESKRGEQKRPRYKRT